MRSRWRWLAVVGIVIVAAVVALWQHHLRQKREYAAEVLKLRGDVQMVIASSSSSSFVDAQDHLRRTVRNLRRLPLDSAKSQAVTAIEGSIENLMGCRSALPFKAVEEAAWFRNCVDKTGLFMDGHLAKLTP